MATTVDPTSGHAYLFVIQARLGHRVRKRTGNRPRDCGIAPSFRGAADASPGAAGLALTNRITGYADSPRGWVRRHHRPAGGAGGTAGVRWSSADAARTSYAFHGIRIGPSKAGPPDACGGGEAPDRGGSDPRMVTIDRSQTTVGRRSPATATSASATRPSCEVSPSLGNLAVTAQVSPRSSIYPGRGSDGLPAPAWAAQG
jgi:hypothetical protein